VYENAYHNIDFVVYENNNEPEYDFVIKPGGNPDEIKFELKAAEKVSVDLAGNLVIETPLGKIEQVKPYSYQIINGEKRVLDSKFSIE